MAEWLFLLVLILAIWFWRDAIWAREIASAAGRRACERDRLQFLDDTVEMVRMRPCRARNGRLQWRRLYRFEFASDGSRRYRGEIDLRGRRVESIHLEPFRDPDGPTPAGPAG